MTLEKLRIDAGMSREDLSRRLGVSAMTIRNWELRYTQPNARQVKALADVFGVSADYLLGRKEVTENG